MPGLTADVLPDDPIPESQMAVFVIRSVNGNDSFAYTPTPYFTDVPATNLYFPWIQKMQDLGIGLPCTQTQYCPDSAVTRGIMAVLIIRSRFGVSTPTSYPATPYFTDVSATHLYFPWIQKMKQLGITAGCTPTTYCPDDPVTRGQMAVFLMRGEFNQGLQDPLTGSTAIYSDFGANLSFTTVPSSSGWCVSGASTPNCGPSNRRLIAVPFTPAGNFTLTQVRRSPSITIREPTARWYSLSIASTAASGIQRP